MLFITAEIHKIFVRIANREDPDQTFFSFYWHGRMRSLRQGVRIWNFEEKNKTKQNKKKKQEKSFGCVSTK